MSKTERWKQRLVIAIREAEDADRIWRTTMALDVPLDDEREVEQAARRLHAVWQEREWARARVRELERLIASEGKRARLSDLSNTRSFLAWHARRRLERNSHRSEARGA